MWSPIRACWTRGEFIQKPFSLKDLAAKVREALEQKSGLYMKL